MLSELYPSSFVKRGLVVAVLVGSAVDAFHPSPALSSGSMKLRGSRCLQVSMATAAPSKFEAMRKKYSRFYKIA